MSLPTDSKARKETPIARGFLDYFPDAVAAVAQVSFAGNQKHNPGEPLHWSKGKSADHADCVARHLIERGTIDAEDGLRHSAKLAWRALALLQIELEDAQPQHDDHYVPAPSDPDTECRDIVALELLNLGCPPDVAKVIAGGTSFYQGDGKIPAKGWVYVAGPMRGHKDFNFPAFDAARDALLEKGYNVISPADIDRAAGFKPQDSVDDTKPFVLRDFWSLFYLARKGGAIALLHGWYRSTGASAEAFLGRWLGLDFLDHGGVAYHSSIPQMFAHHND